MSHFQFRMDNILNIREKLEEKKKQEYGKALSRLEIENEKKQKLMDEKNFLLQTLNHKVEEKVSPNEVISYNQYIHYLKKKTIEQDKIVRNAAQYVQKKHEELLESVKQKKMLELLKEKQWIEFQEEANKQEQKIIDEIVSFKSQGRLEDGGKENG